MHRFAAVLVALVAVVHLVGQHLWLGESPVWFNAIFLVWFKVLDRAVDQWIIGLVLAGIVFALAVWIGAAQSRLAALLFAVLSGWDAWFRFRQVQATLADDNLALGLPMIAGAVATALALLIALFALVATYRPKERRGFSMR